MNFTKGFWKEKKAQNLFLTFRKFLLLSWNICCDPKIHSIDTRLIFRDSDQNNNISLVGCLREINVNEKSQGKVFNCESVESKIYVWQVISKYLSKVYKRTSILLSMTREILNFSKKTLGTKEKRAFKNSVYRQSPHEYTLVWQTFKVLLCFYLFIV